MCDCEGPASVTQALAALDRALDHLNTADAASPPSDVQAQALRAPERAGAKHTAARARLPAARAAQAGGVGLRMAGCGRCRRWRGLERSTRRAGPGCWPRSRRRPGTRMLGTAVLAPG